MCTKSVYNIREHSESKKRAKRVRKEKKESNKNTFSHFNFGNRCGVNKFVIFEINKGILKSIRGEIVFRMIIIAQNKRWEVIF